MRKRAYHITADEITFIRDSRATMTIPQMAAKLGCTERSISLHIARMGLAKPVKEPLTVEQHEFVRANAGTMPQHEIGKHIGRSQDSVRRLVKRMGLHGRKANANSVSGDEHDFIRANWLNMSDAQMAERLGRTICAVQCQRQKLGLKRASIRPAVKATAPGACRMVREQTRAARGSYNRATDTADRAAEYLASFDRTPVFRIGADGKPHLKGNLWRYGTTRLTTDEMMAKATRKGFDPDWWRRLAA